MAWVTPSNITTNGPNLSSCTLTGASQIGNYIVGSNFSFAVSTSVFLLGFQVHANKTTPSPDISGQRQDDSIIIVVGASTSTDKSTGAQWNATTDYGGPTDNWGLNGLRGADLANLSVKMAPQSDSSSIGGGTVRITNMTLTVTYQFAPLTQLYNATIYAATLR